MPECNNCWGTGWVKNEHCPDCDGLGETEEDPFYIGADLIYEAEKDRKAEER